MSSDICNIVFEIVIIMNGYDMGV